MQVVPPRLRRAHPFALAIAAALCAAALVLYLQHRAITTLERQTATILHQISEQTASAVVSEVRRTLEGPVFDTLTALNHPQIQDGRLDLLAGVYGRGLSAYPQVQRFLVWTERTDTVLPGEALFYGRGGEIVLAPVPAGVIPPGFTRDPDLGHEVVALARRHAPAQQIYAAFDRMGREGRYDIFLRLFWTDARRDRYFAVIGFVVDRVEVRRTFFAELHRRRLDAMLKVRGDDLPLGLRVIDEQGATVWGTPAGRPMGARVSFPLVFYPAQDIATRLAARVEPLDWTVEVGPVDTPAMLAVSTQGYWLPALSVILMVVAMTLTVQAGRRADEMARMQADFVSHVSHQLKTPLSLLSAVTETVALDRVRSPEKLAQYLEIIRTEVGHLSSLVQRILEVSRMQQRQALEFEVVDLVALVRETVDAFQRSLSGQDFTFRVEQERGDLHVDADPAALEQVLANLLDNAVKYSDEVKEVTVRVGGAGPEAVVEVIDRGIGIPEGERRRIFEKFYRGSGATHHRQGFGLGLPIVQELVTAHRGRIDVHSVLNEGTTFRVTLPVTSAGRHRSGAPVEVTS